MLVMAELGKDNRDIFYSNKMKALHSGRDSVVIHPRTAEQHYQRETVYEIVKTKRGSSEGSATLSADSIPTRWG